MRSSTSFDASCVKAGFSLSTCLLSRWEECSGPNQQLVRRRSFSGIPTYLELVGDVEAREFLDDPYAMVVFHKRFQSITSRRSSEVQMTI